MLVITLIVLAILGTMHLIAWIVKAAKRPIKPIERITVTRIEYFKDLDRLSHNGWQIGRTDNRYIYLYREVNK